MGLVRFEPKKHPSNELYYLEIYHPADSQQPFVTTEARYKTAAAAENDVIAIIASMSNTPSAQRVG